MELLCGPYLRFGGTVCIRMSTDCCEIWSEDCRGVFSIMTIDISEKFKLSIICIPMSNIGRRGIKQPAYPRAVTSIMRLFSSVRVCVCSPYISWMQTYFNEAHHNYSLTWHDPHNTNDILRSLVKGRDQPAIATEILSTWQLMNHWRNLNWNKNNRIKFQGNGFKSQGHRNLFLAEAYQSMVRRQRPSIVVSWVTECDKISRCKLL